MAGTFVYREADGCSIGAALHPASAPKAPLLVYIHGGGLIWGTKEDMNKQQIARYNEAGFNVLSVDYRLAPETKLPGIREDIGELFKWVKGEAAAQFDYDTERVAAVGGSAGGYLALLAGTFAVRPDAIVSFYGYGQVTGDWYRKPSPHFTGMPAVPKLLADQLVKPSAIAAAPIQQRYAIYLYCRQSGTWLDWVAGEELAGDAAELGSYAPVQLADAQYPATLLIHGDADEDVPYSESLAMKEKLDALGVYNELLTIPRGQHNFDADMDDPDSVRAVERTIQFLKQRFAMK
ncbi:alpha/beta hydrolase [Sporosarcina sp. NCCP-2716]|uniref:alpha/beta hydrolase n=1 Tax=Sporosarcina sp. NCCP-2716 TaxID=2943679 RepID=UPI00203C279A|nr:alpha/beta hydrolase [Sporosarcina sp. NCCP-2716]GKV68578.1 alpha/beta hydrolase [Sporosarcina sp. NCCP-2716]